MKRQTRSAQAVIHPLAPSPIPTTNPLSSSQKKVGEKSWTLKNFQTNPVVVLSLISFRKREPNHVEKVPPSPLFPFFLPFIFKIGTYYRVKVYDLQYKDFLLFQGQIEKQKRRHLNAHTYTNKPKKKRPLSKRKKGLLVIN